MKVSRITLMIELDTLEIFSAFPLQVWPILPTTDSKDVNLCAYQWYEDVENPFEYMAQLLRDGTVCRDTFCASF